ncbi:MAG: PD-(D/E)XK nuclease family protein, partial [Gammaproteobacteria bacterium]
WIQEQWRLGRYTLPSDHRFAGRLRVLSGPEEWVIWQKLVSATSGIDLLDTGGLAKSAQEAYRIQCGWCMKTQEIEAHAVGDHVFYVQWLREFRQICAELKVLSSADVLRALVALPDAAMRRLDTCCWLGFSELMPAEARLFEAMPRVWGVTPYRESLARYCDGAKKLAVNVAVNAAVTEVTAETKDKDDNDNDDDNGNGGLGACGQWRSEDETTALQDAIRWIGQRTSPTAKVALVVPDLPTRKLDVEREWVEQWVATRHPSARLMLPDASLEASPLAEWVNLSGGTRLASLPLYRVVTAVLAFAQGSMNQQDVRELLVSPYVVRSETERWARWRLWECISTLQQRRWSVSALHREWRQAGLAADLSACPAWEAALAQGVAWFENLNTTSDTVGAAHRIPACLDHLLSIWGWPGDAGLDSVEYQQLKRWGAVREQWAAMLSVLERLGESVTMSVAARFLLELLNTQLFQPQSRETPVQILGILEALEQPFDALWVLGAHSDALPAAARPHPLLPLSLQTHYNSLRATPARELALAREIVRAFQALNGEVCFSWPARIGGREMSPSRLIASFPDWSTEQTEANRTARAEWVMHAETHAPVIGDRTRVRGGTQLLKTFAECPFKAFVRYRLGLNLPSVPGLGLGPLERGVLVHGVLESIWKTLGDQEALLRLAPDALEQLVTEHVQRTVQAMTLPPGLFLGEALLANEEHRLRRVIMAWLSYDKQREPFRVVSVEASMEMELAGMPLSLRVDRVDETPDGAWLVMDYKTGAVDVGQWFGKRLQAPQLPLYGVALLPKTRGLLFAVVKVDKPVVRGLVAEGVAVMHDAAKARGIRPESDWTQRTALWRQTLTQSAEEYLAGLAVVDPIEGAKTCERCGFQTLCRIQERVQQLSLEP